MRTPEGLARAYLEQGLAAGKSRTWAEQARCRLGHFLAWLDAQGCKDLSEATETTLLAYLLAESKRKGRRPGGQPLASSTLHAQLWTLRGFFRFLVKNDAVLYNPALEASLGKCVKGYRRAPSREEVLRLLAVEGKSPLDLRDRAILEVLYSTGLRSEELCALVPGDVDLSSGVLTVRKGKGGKGRLVPIGESAVKAVREYLRRGRLALKPSTPALFVTQHGRRLQNVDLRCIFRKRNLRAGLESPITPHHLRHAFATHLLEAGASLRYVQAMLGHDSAASTQIYTHVRALRLKETLERCDIRAALEVPSPEELPPGLGRFSF